ncbi:MAG TPA: diadenylate cyclase CdaA [Ardenticatenaceae bacterium]|nr:diadenylate cyclase CdaA [Ardenticatenaceae bacterium]
MTPFRDLWLTFTQFGWTSVLDILLVALVIYAVLYLVRDTQAVQLLRGLLVLALLVFFLTQILSLTAFSWLIRNAIPALLIAVPVIFQPEIRRGLERLGRTGFLFGRSTPEGTMTRVITHVCRAAQRLSERRYGALIVFERDVSLQEIVNTGVTLDAVVSPELLTTIFFRNTTLHDGAVIIRGERIVAAAAVLPLASDLNDRRLGTRHRAAIGVTTSTDALAVVVSEETGTISLTYNGRIIRHLDEERLNRLLHAFYGPQSQPGFRQWWRRRQGEPATQETPSPQPVPLARQTTARESAAQRPESSGQEAV